MLAPYSREADLRRLEQYVSVFSEGFWPASVGCAGQTTPVFIVGMMRSGSTLLEQILTSHSRVHGMGEDSVFNAVLPVFRDTLMRALMGTWV